VVDDQNNDLVMQWNYESTGGAGPSTMLFQSRFTTSYEDGKSRIGSFLAVKAVTDSYPINKYNESRWVGWSPLPARVYYATFDWCTNKFRNVSASQKGITPGSIISEGLTWVSHVEVGNEGNVIGTNYYT
jgi:hypothetical protein